MKMQKDMAVTNSSEAILSTYIASSENHLSPVPFLPVIANDTVDIEDDLMEVGTIGFDRIAQFYFYDVCLSEEFLRAFPFCFNPKLAFLKPQHVVTAIVLEQFAFEHSVRGFCNPLVSSLFTIPFYKRLLEMQTTKHWTGRISHQVFLQP